MGSMDSPLSIFRSVRRGETLPVGQPLILVRVVWHIEIREKTLRAQVGVDRKESLAHEGRGFQIREEVLEEMRRIDIASIGVVIDLLWALVYRAIIVNDNLIYGENGQSPSNPAGIGGPLFAGDAATQDVSSQNQASLCAARSLTLQ